MGKRSTNTKKSKSKILQKKGELIDRKLGQFLGRTIIKIEEFGGPGDNDGYQDFILDDGSIIEGVVEKYGKRRQK